ncbi:hypothetical protein KP509_11G013800 [Ceratopteris richardii]|uniref:Uncharacterized protein n=1 Tax=Ceratopteris richardii TaxID=49495 RepID=A0A8T2TQG3_CERRI|nr:hypothetical protein KP509_11G013800 [Ceratopteris richardii]
MRDFSLLSLYSPVYWNISTLTDIFTKLHISEASSVEDRCLHEQLEMILSCCSYNGFLFSLGDAAFTTSSHSNAVLPYFRLHSWYMFGFFEICSLQAYIRVFIYIEYVV